MHIFEREYSEVHHTEHNAVRYNLLDNQWALIHLSLPLLIQQKISGVQKYNLSYPLMQRRQLKSPRSVSGRSIHLALVTKWSWSWMTYCHPLCAMSIGPPILRYSYFKIWQWKSMVKVMWSKVKVTFDLENSRSRSRTMSILKATFEAWNSIDMFGFPVVAIGPLLCWDIGNSVFDLENSRLRSRPRSNLRPYLRPWRSNYMFAFRFLAIAPFLAEI